MHAPAIRRSLSHAFLVTLISAVAGASPGVHGTVSDAGGRAASAPTLERGALLVAARRMADPNFRETVVLLVAYGRRDGAAGLIVNRRTDVPLRVVVPDLPVPRGAWPSAFDGGPVSRREAKGLWRSPLNQGDAARVAQDTVLLGSASALEQAIANGATAGRLRVYLGYAGWAPGQLEREVARGDWHVMAGDSDVVFASEPEGVWRSLIRQADVVVAEIFCFSGAHQAAGYRHCVRHTT